MRTITQVAGMIIGAMAAWVVSMLTTGADSWKESDGKAVTVSLNYSVNKNDVAVVNSWLGVAAQDGDSGDSIALDISPIERQFTVPAALGLTIGDICYIDITDLTGHKPDDTAYGTSAGSNKVAFFKATSNQSSTFVTGIVLGQLLS